jgi:hypothetical protein
MSSAPKEVVRGFMSVADRWHHQVEENYQLKLILAEKGAEIKMNQLERERLN